MSGRVWLLFGVVLLTITLCFRKPHAHELPCFMKESSALESLATTRGYGLAEEGLIKLGVNTNGTFILTVSPPGQPVICIFVMGENWEWVVPKLPNKISERKDD